MDMDKNRRILVVDDDEISLQAITSLLEATFCCDVDAVKSSEEALNRIYLLCMEWQPKWYDLILTDVCLPTLNGTLLAKIIRETEPNLQETPIIAVSGVTTAVDREKYMRKEITDFLPKPITAEQLKGIMEKYLQ